MGEWHILREIIIKAQQIVFFFFRGIIKSKMNSMQPPRGLFKDLQVKKNLFWKQGEKGKWNKIRVCLHQLRILGKRQRQHGSKMNLCSQRHSEIKKEHR